MNEKRENILPHGLTVRLLAETNKFKEFHEKQEKIEEKILNNRSLSGAGDFISTTVEQKFTPTSKPNRRKASNPVKHTPTQIEVQNPIDEPSTLGLVNITFSARNC